MDVPSSPADALDSPPDALTPHQPKPASTPGPAATPHLPHAVVNAASPSKASPLLSPVSGGSAPCATQGRSKLQRWLGDFSGTRGVAPTPAGEADRPTFRDIILCSPTSPSSSSRLAAPVALPPLETTALPPPLAGRRRSRGLVRASGPPQDGWTRVESRKARRRRLQLPLSVTSVPRNLLGRCFNCFAEDHFVASCRLRTRCLRCMGLSHSSYNCPDPAGRPASKVPVHRRLSKGPVWGRLSPAVSAGPVRLPAAPKAHARASGGSVWDRLRPPTSPPGGVEVQRMVWRRVSTQNGGNGSGHTLEASNGRTPALVISSSPVEPSHIDAPGLLGTLPPRHRRRRHRKRRSSIRGGSDPGPDHVDQPGGDETLLDQSSGVKHGSCIIGWNNHFSKAVDDLGMRSLFRLLVIFL
jgi:hypothetical protein